MATPKPIIAQVLSTLRVPPGLIYALVNDLEQNLWVVESCPAGTRFWTLEQASELSQGPRTHRALQEILNLGRATQRRRQMELSAQKTSQSTVPIRVGREVSADRIAPQRQSVGRVRTLTSPRKLVLA